MWSTATGLIGALIPMLIGCASGSGRSECPVIRQAPASHVPAAALVATPNAPSSPSAPLASVTSQVSPAAPSAPTSVVSDGAGPSAATPASTGAALPELKLHLSGMHIGGGPNDEATKRPFIQAIEGAFEAMRACYKKSEDPTRGGTFGVDLKIPNHGGKPELQQVRTAMKGEPLRECLQNAFRGISFGPPPKGPTVVSVSVRFTLDQ